MSGRLVGEVHAWLRTPRARALGLNVTQRMILSAIAERASEISREMWSHRSDGCTQFEYLMEVVGVGKSALADALNGLAEKKLEVRIEIGKTRAGKPIFAHRGKAMRFMLPILPASVGLPIPVAPEPDEPVDNPGTGPVDSPPGEAPTETESLRSAGPITPKASGEPDPMAPKASGLPDPSPYKDTPSKDLSLTPEALSSHLNLEGTRPAAAAEHARTIEVFTGFDTEYQNAVVALTRFPDFGEKYIARARTELGDTASRQQLYIRAAHIASEGIPV